MREFISLDECAQLNETTKLNLQKLRWADKKRGRTDRFVGDEVLINYLNPLFWELHEWYFKAMEVAGDRSYHLATKIASVIGEKPQSTYKYFWRMSFKNQNKARKVLKALKAYCKENDLWYACGLK